MNSPYYFVIEPLGSEYNNEIEILGQKIIVNSTVENHKHVNRFAKIKYLPKRYKGIISVGDVIIVHHNIFRLYYDMQGNPKKSPNYFKDGLYFIDEGQFYTYNNGTGWKCIGDYCFVKPVHKEKSYLYEEGYSENIGIIKYGNPNLYNNGVFEGDKVAYRKNSEYEFIIDGEDLYRMRTNDITAVL